MSRTIPKVMRLETNAHTALLGLDVERQVLSSIGVEPFEQDCKTEDEIIAAAKEADILLIVYARITRRVLSSLPKLIAAIRYGVGFDTIDVEAATDNNVLVVNIPDYCYNEVSDHLMAMVLACHRYLVPSTKILAQGGWRQAQEKVLQVPSLAEQTVGIIGCGNIGCLAADKARAFGLKVLGYDPYLNPAVAGLHGIVMVSLIELLRQADFVCLQAPLNKETYHLIGEKELKLMKPTAYVINTSRGGLVDEQALVTALREKWISGAALDVFEKEPVEARNPLLGLENIILTPHTAAQTSTAMRQLKINVAHEAVRILTGKWPRNLVNKKVQPKVPLVREN